MLNTLWRTGLAIAVGVALLLPPGGPQAEGAAVPAAVFPEKIYEFDAVDEGVEVKHDFIIENRGRAPLEIKKVQPD